MISIAASGLNSASPCPYFSFSKIGLSSTVLSVAILFQAVFLLLSVAIPVTSLATGQTSSGLTAFWKFDEGSLIAASDYSGNGNTGTLINSPTFTAGKVGGGLSFDGANDYVKASSAAQTGSFSVSLWAKANKTNQAEWSGIFASADSPASNTFQIDIGGTSSWAAIQSISLLWP